MGDLLSALVQRSKQIADPLAAAYASGNRAFTVELSRPGADVTFDRDAKAFLNPADPVLYTGPARIYTITGGMELQIGDEDMVLSSARISIDSYDGPAPQHGDLLTIIDTAQAQNTHAVGRVFQVEDVEIGGHFGIGYTMTTRGVAPSPRT